MMPEGSAHRPECDPPARLLNPGIPVHEENADAPLRSENVKAAHTRRSVTSPSQTAESEHSCARGKCRCTSQVGYGESSANRQECNSPSQTAESEHSRAPEKNANALLRSDTVKTVHTGGSNSPDC
jgi:hypothetical protein